MKECPACRRCFPDEINHCPQDGDATTPSLLGEPILDARYQLERRLGQGGMGVVFQARHIFLKTSHAIKVILPDLVGNDPMLVTRFRQEALAAAAIRHQNIIAVTDFGVVRGTMPFLVMEFVSGRSLHEMLNEEGAMPPPRALELISAIGAGVAAAHRQNIVHRDLKPLNIMTQDKMPVAEGLKILDFGLAKIKSGELLGSFIQAKTSGLMGSPFYMAPEQWSDDEPDARADIYSMGIILYQMLAGDVPFKGSSIPSIMKKHLTQSPPSFKSMGVQVAPEIEAVVRHALEKDIGGRIPSVEAFLGELRQAITSVDGTLTVRRETGAIDPNKTFASPLPPKTVSPAVGEQTNQSNPAFDSMAGTVSSAALSEELEQQISSTAQAHRRDREAQERTAREELAREAEARREAEAEATRKRDQDSERQRKEEEEREERERQHQEQLERVSRQASELEERLARLATSMPPQTTVMDPEATQVHHAAGTRPVGESSFSPLGLGLEGSQPGFAEVGGKRKISLLLPLGAALVLLLLAAGVGGYFLMKPTATQPTKTEETATTQPQSFKADLVEIPGGTFQMGRNDGPPQERPQHTATVQPFLIDRTEVTNAEYAEFVRDTNYQAPSHWVKGQPLTGQERWPVVNVSPIDAQAFAAWRSKRDGVVYRLPTEQEWEYAARNGGEYQLYPWGDRWEERHAVVKEAAPRPVGSYPEGADRWGVLDLIGNVWEWSSSKASLYGGNAAQIPSATKEWVVARGGSYASDPNDRQIPVSATYRDWFDPTLRHPNFGFRLARSAQ
jgi:formylglycine-generating enzyme required for sulfatase activity/serine/threonine protein kinase